MITKRAVASLASRVPHLPMAVSGWNALASRPAIPAGRRQRSRRAKSSTCGSTLAVHDAGSDRTGSTSPMRPAARRFRITDRRRPPRGHAMLVNRIPRGRGPTGLPATYLAYLAADDLDHRPGRGSSSGPRLGLIAPSATDELSEPAAATVQRPAGPRRRRLACDRFVPPRAACERRTDAQRVATPS